MDARMLTPLPTADARWAVEQACRAPSLHNTQPWRFEWNGFAFDLYADTTRGLTASDPDGRELVISCGAALYNLRLALRKLGYDAHVTLLPSHAQRRLLARVAATEGAPASPAERRAYAGLSRRHTHRSAFEDRPLETGLAVLLQRAAEEEHADLVYVNDPGQRRRVLQLARAAERALSAHDGVQTELLWWTPSPGTARRDGIPATAYAADVVTPADDLPARDFDQGRGIGRLEGGEQPPGAIAVLTSRRDLEVDWLQAGQAMERVLITAAEQWAFAAVHSQVVEVPDLRGELRRELCTSGYPQMLMRFGYAPTSQLTPRRPVDEVLTVREEKAHVH